MITIGVIVELERFKWNKHWDQLEEFFYDFHQHKTNEMQEVESYCNSKLKQTNNKFKREVYLDVIKFINEFDTTPNILVSSKQLLMELFRLNYEEGYSKMEIMKMYLNNDERIQYLKELGNYDNEEWILRLLGGNFVVEYD